MIRIHKNLLLLLVCVIIGGFLFLAIGTVGGYLLGNTKQQTYPATNQIAQVTPAPDIPIPTDLPPLAVEPISEWKIYKNKDYNFTLKYPPSYTIRADKSPEDIVSFMREGNFLDIKVEKVPFANYKLDLGGAGTRAQFDATSKIWIGLYSGLPDNHIKRSNSTIEAYEVPWGDGGHQGTLLIIPSPSYSYVITIDNSIGGIERNNNRVANPYSLPSSLLLSTFQFTN